MRIHGGDIAGYLAEYGELPLDFSANINPLGMPEEALAAARAAVDDALRYPDTQCRALRASIGGREGVAAGQVLCGNGAADLIYRFAAAVRPAEALVCAPTFGEYAPAFAAAGSRVRTHRLRVEDGFCVTDAILPALAGAGALVLCNPNNPTGLPVAPALLKNILAACDTRGIRVLLDECFIDFLDDAGAHTSVGVLADHPGLVVLKALTKFYGMPGLRLGYALCADEELLARMDAAGPPWSVNGPAQAAGIAALGAHGYAERTRALIGTERPFLTGMLRALGLNPIGEANFLLFEAPPGLPEALRRAGVLVRDCADFDGLGAGWVRVAVRTRTENLRLLSRLSRCLEGPK